MQQLLVISFNTNNKYIYLIFISTTARSGSYGKVKLVIDSKTQTAYAAKILNKTKLKKKLLNRRVSAYNMVEKEMAVMKKLAHPNICKLFEIIDDPSEEKVYLIMEYVKHGSVNSKNYWKMLDKDNQIPHDKGIPLERIINYLRDFLSGLDYRNRRRPNTAIKCVVLRLNERCRQFTLLVEPHGLLRRPPFADLSGLRR